MAQERWRAFFEEIVGMVTTGERHFGICNANYCDHMIERIELSIQSCQAITNTLSSVTDGSIAECKQSIDQLIDLLQTLLDEWKEYQMLLDSNAHHSAYHVPVQHASRRKVYC